jgi:hypothetical protein
MSIPALIRQRKLAGVAAAVLLFSALGCLADGLVAGFKGEAYNIQGVPGSVHPLTSNLPPGAATLEEMRAVSEGEEGVTLTPKTLFTGFWLGGTMWNGEIAIAPNAAPGRRIITLHGPPLPEGSRKYPLPTIQVTVHESPEALRKASASFITRHLGVNPFSASVFLVVLALPPGILGFFLSRRIEGAMAVQGKGFIYMVKQTEDGQLIAFSMGSDQGLVPGEPVRLENVSGQPLGVARVIATLSGDCTAKIVSGQCEVGDMAVRADAPESGQPSP